MNLSPEQQTIVNHKDGALLVEAGPGSGKTRVLTERIKTLLSSQKRGKVLALTFSNLAADEMKDRLSKDHSFDDQIERVTIGTIHSFCLDVVQSRGNVIGLSTDMVLFENEEDRKGILKEAVFDNPQLTGFFSQSANPNLLLQRVLQRISEQKKSFVSPSNCAIAAPFPSIYAEYNRKLLSQNALDFDDILFFAYKILVENQNIVKMYNSLYRYICVDEAQDLNFAQYQVIKALCGNGFRNVMMVGDPKQSIYGFNGSNSQFMTERFMADFSPKVYRLNQNYRSSKAIVRFANKLGHYDSVTNYVYDGELTATRFDDEQREAEYVANKFEQLVKTGHPEVEGSISTDNVAVIARNRYAFSELEREFESRLIPFYFKKSNTGGIENESKLMRVFDLSVRLLINGKDYLHLSRLCELLGCDVPDLSLSTNSSALLQSILYNTEYQCVISAVQKLNSDTLNFKDALSYLKEYLNSQALNDETKYLASMDIAQWESHWSKYVSLVPRESRSLTSFRNQISLGKTRKINSTTGIPFLTAHMSKGLQFDVVFIIGLSEGTFPDYRAIQNGGDELKQEKNNMYVAVTRAKRLCYMSYPARKKMPWGAQKLQQPSRYIQDICVNSS